MLNINPYLERFIFEVKSIFMCNFLGNIFVSLRSRLNISVYAAKAGLIR
jgi:hypothetical protein